MDKNTLLAVLAKFKGKKIMVLGDMIADEYVFGRTTRVSREAPVLILKYDSTEIMLGGAANSVNNVNALGGDVYPVGMVGDDVTGQNMLQIMKDKRIHGEGILINPDMLTITKTRIMAGGHHLARQQVIRIDKENDGILKKGIEDKIISYIKKVLPKMDALLISDYGEGVVSERVRASVLELVKKSERILVVDSRFNIMKYEGATLITPNETEAAPAVGMRLDAAEAVFEIGRKLMKKIQGKGVLITQGRNGMTLFEEQDKAIHIDIVGSEEAVDVTGAGDTVASCAVIALSAGAGLLEAAHLSNFAASIVVMKRGTATVTVEEIKELIHT